MRVLAVRLWTAALCSLLLLACLPVFAFDEDRNVLINGAMLHFRVRGADKANPYLVILHGGPGFSSPMFYTWGASLEKQINVVYLDQRGCGESARLSVANVMAPTPSEIKGYTFKTLVADIEGVRKALKVNKWYVLGHSYGGMLGLEYVTAHPDHVLGYIHMDGLVSVPQMQNAVLDDAAKKFSAATPKDDTNLASVAQLRALPVDNPARLFGAFSLAMGPAGLYFAGDQKAEFAEFYAQVGAAVKPYAVPYAALMPASEPGAALIDNSHFLTRDDTPLLAKISVPMLIINGKEDGVIPPQSAEAVHAAVKNSQLVELEHCGHFPFFEQPEQTTAAILGFVHSQTDALSETGSPREVIVDYIVDEKGQVKDAKVVKSCGDMEIDSACREAVEKTHFRPEIKNGQAVAVPGQHTFVLSE